MSERPLALRLYGLLARTLAPGWRFGLQRRLNRGKETAASVQQKLGLAYDARPPGPLVWGHAVGVGESLALAGLFARLGEQRPHLHFLITTTARTSGSGSGRSSRRARTKSPWPKRRNVP